MYSNPPVHGARVASTLLTDPKLNAQWCVSVLFRNPRCKKPKLTKSTRWTGSQRSREWQIELSTCDLPFSTSWRKSVHRKTGNILNLKLECSLTSYVFLSLPSISHESVLTAGSLGKRRVSRLSKLIDWHKNITFTWLGTVGFRLQVSPITTLDISPNHFTRSPRTMRKRKLSRGKGDEVVSDFYPLHSKTFFFTNLSTQVHTIVFCCSTFSNLSSIRDGREKEQVVDSSCERDRLEFALSFLFLTFHFTFL